ncbi:transposase zinc-binding domain-containing protein [Pseudomonadota bacterium]
MNSPITLQSILNHHLETYQHTRRLSPQQSKACHHLQQCRTEVLGGRSLKCMQCGQSQVQYHSCRNRHCPQCQGRATTQWSERQTLNLLPVVYYHVIFTLPHSLNTWVQLHPREIYSTCCLKVHGAPSRPLAKIPND